MESDDKPCGRSTNIRSSEDMYAMAQCACTGTPKPRKLVKEMYLYRHTQAPQAGEGNVLVQAPTSR